MTITRRNLLGSLGALGTLSLWPSSRARAATGPANHFVLVFARGGWDPTFVFDPKPDSPYVDTGGGQFSPFGSGALWLDPSRPSVSDFFTRYGAITSVLNGINVPSIAHPSCTTRMLTGSRSASKPDLGAMIGHELGEGSPLPYLDIGGTAYPGPYGADMGYLGARNQIKNLVIEQSAYSPPEGSEEWKRHFLSGEETTLVRDFVEQRLARETERTAHGYNRQLQESFMLGLDRGHQLAEFEGFFSGMGSGKSTEAQVEIAVNALAVGVSRSVHMSTSGSFDTHDDNTEQVEQFESTFAGLVNLMDLLATTPSRFGGMLVDDTLVMLVSEMGRTPRINDAGGKDHWPFTSCLIAGCGVRGETIVGASDETFVGRRINLETGVADEAGELLNSEYVLAGVLERFGIDPESYLPGITPFRGFHAE